MNGHPAFPSHLTTPQPIEAILPGLGFAKTELGFARRWSGLEFVACEDPLAWTLMREGRVTEREMWPPHQRRVISPMKPIELMATLYKMWADTFETTAPQDEPLCLGKAWLDYQRELRNLIPPPPTLYAEREYFRFCLTHIERRYDWAEDDYAIVFSQIPGQLRIRAGETEFHCPAEGEWIGEAVVSARELFRRLPKRLMGPTAYLQMNDNKLLIDGRPIAARWHEQDDASSA
jgi:hypothetical protein